MAKAGRTPEKRTWELRQMAKGLWVTEKSGHAGEGEQTSEQTNVICDRLRACPGQPASQPPPSLPPPLLQPHFSCWVMSSSSLR